MDTDPEYDVADEGLNRTVTVCEEPGASENEPPPLTIKKPEPEAETLADSVPEELEALEIVKLSSVLWPTFTVPNGIDVRLRLMSMTGVMVTVTVAIFPSMVAEMAALPADRPVIRPVDVTGATAALLELHEATRPVKVLPEASRGVAVSWMVAPTWIEPPAGVIDTEATGSATVVVVLGSHPAKTRTTNAGSKRITRVTGAPGLRPNKASLGTAGVQGRDT
jgi:hypothetical protein